MTPHGILTGKKNNTINRPELLRASRRIIMILKTFKIADITGVCYSVACQEGNYRDVMLEKRVAGTAYRVFITKNIINGRVQVAWKHEDLSDSRRSVADCDSEYDVREGFWLVVQEVARDLAAGRIPPECFNDEDLPEFLNTEGDDMGFLDNPETGDRISWSGEAV